jgi:hypothetical protein
MMAKAIRTFPDSISASQGCACLNQFHRFAHSGGVSHCGRMVSHYRNRAELHEDRISNNDCRQGTYARYPVDRGVKLRSEKLAA